MAAGVSYQSGAVQVGGQPGDEDKVIAGVEGRYFGRSCLHLLFWTGSQGDSLAVF